MYFFKYETTTKNVAKNKKSIYRNNTSDTILH